jgi:hypothetical protein
LAVGGGNLLFGDRLLLLEVLLAFFESVPLIGFIVLPPRKALWRRATIFEGSTENFCLVSTCGFCARSTVS